MAREGGKMRRHEPQFNFLPSIFAVIGREWEGRLKKAGYGTQKTAEI